MFHQYYTNGNLTSAVTGFCECTGTVAPLLGGGHGILQGLHGLLADNLLSARLVLANGTAITVSSESHADLFWALRGAGHNFGIVAEFTYRIYDIPDTNWSYSIFTFTGDKLEALYEQINQLGVNGNHPAELTNFSNWLRLPDVDSNVSDHKIRALPC